MKRKNPRNIVIKVVLSEIPEQIRLKKKDFHLIIQEMSLYEKVRDHVKIPHMKIISILSKIYRLAALRMNQTQKMNT